MSRRRNKRSRFQRKKLLRSVFGLVVFLALFFYAEQTGLLEEAFPQHGTQGTVTAEEFPTVNQDELAVYFLDVGQGDSTLLRIPNGEKPYTMLIDTGEYEYADGLTEMLQSLGVETIDALVCSHQHTDHMGCMARIVERFEIGGLYLPNLPAESVPTTSAYEALLTAVDETDTPVYALYRGAEIEAPESVEVSVLAPEEDAAWDDLNNFSAVIRVQYGDTAFLFTGDAETESEKIILEHGDLLSADVLKCGHHGSKTSSSEKFLTAVFPDYAIISCGIDNSYGHPHEETLQRLSALGSEILETDEDGTILAVSDGSTVTVTVGLPSVTTLN